MENVLILLSCLLYEMQQYSLLITAMVNMNNPRSSILKPFNKQDTRPLALSRPGEKLRSLKLKCDDLSFPHQRKIKP